MNPKYKKGAFLGSVLVLMAPFLAFMLYCSRQFSPARWPSWATNTIALWFVVNFLLIVLMTKRIFKGETAELRKADRPSRIAQIVVSYLLILWSLFFLFGLREAIRGDVPLGRALPAGAFLLFFIGLFGWSLYRSRRGKA